MSGDSIDDPGQRHREAWQLIPWLVNGTANDAERQRAEAHIAVCADCRDEVALQERIRDGFTAAGVGSAEAAQAAFARLAARVDETASMDTPFDAPLSPPVRMTAWTYALAAAVIVQAIGLVVLAAQLAGRPPPADYRTYSDGQTTVTGASIRFVPAPELGVGALQSLLAEHGLRIVGGHADQPIFALAPTRPIDVAQTLAALRARPDVLLAEPILSDDDAR